MKNHTVLLSKNKATRPQIARCSLKNILQLTCMGKINTESIPKEVSRVAKTLKNSGFSAYLIGGCVRDLMLKKEPKDWDFTTNATPEEIQKLFPDSVYENSFGTVGVKIESEDPTLKIIEVTPYRTEATYSDNRHPDKVSFSDKLEEDLARRDFTINSLAYDPESAELVDIYKGQNDLKDKIIRTVGDPSARFQEDALRLLRAVRLSAELSFQIEDVTREALQKNAKLLAKISQERIRDEFTKILNSANPSIALEVSRETSLLEQFIPELLESVGIEQGGAHKYEVWEHLMKSLAHAVGKDYPFHVKLAVLFHDIGKPASRRAGSKKEWTFYGHEVIGAKMTKKILERMHFSRETIEKVTKLVRWHMFFADTEQISQTAIRRMIRNVGQDMIWDLMNVRICDRIGMGRPKEDPYRLRKYHSMIEEVMSDPVSVGMLKMNGDILIKELHVKPGKEIGWVLHALLEEVLEDPGLNDKIYLLKRSKELLSLDAKDLQKLGEKGKEMQEEKEQEKIEKIRKRHFVE